MDGGYHFEPAQRLKDKERQQALEGMGLYFLRFEDGAVRKDMNLVLQKITAYITAFERDHPQTIRCRKKPAEWA